MGSTMNKQDINSQYETSSSGYESTSEECYSDVASECSSYTSRSSRSNSIVSDIKQTTARQSKLLGKLLRRLVKSKSGKFEEYTTSAAEFECVTCARFDLTAS